MPHLTQPITPDGALIDVLIGVSTGRGRALHSSGQPVPRPLAGRGQLDTGASMTCVDSSLIQALGLVPTGSTRLATPSATGGVQVYDVYDINLGFVHPSVNRHLDLSVVVAPLSAQGFEVLVGRDALRHCLLVYDGPAGSFAFAF